MAEKPRTRSAKIKASFGRSDRLRRERGEAQPARTAASRKKETAGQPRQERAPKPDARETSPRAAAHTRKQTPLQLIEARLERAAASADKRSLQRLQDETRTAFNREGERRRDTARRAEFERKRDALQAKERRIEEYRRVANVRRLERKAGELKREMNKVADRRRDHARRVEQDRQKALQDERQKDQQRRAALEIEKEQKRRTADQQAAHRRETDVMRSRHRVQRDSFRTNESIALERHHNAIKGIDAREERELADFDGRRRGLAGRAAEIIPGRRAENDQKRADMVRGYESERLHKHRDLEAYKERLFENEMKALRDRALERKALMELHRDDRASFGREQADARPKLVDERARVIERADQAREQERERARPEQDRENVQTKEEFTSAASGHAREPVPGTSTLHRGTEREMCFERGLDRA